MFRLKIQPVTGVRRHGHCAGPVGLEEPAPSKYFYRFQAIGNRSSESDLNKRRQYPFTDYSTQRYAYSFS